MSELLVKNPPGALAVSEVAPGSAAERAGIRPGDLIQSVNGRRLVDVVDYQFHTAARRLRLDAERDRKRLTFDLAVPEGETPGLRFLHALGDKVHTCNNKCVFCFIHQMPRKMRKSLYLMDDDFRLSFLHGHYVTLTNLTAEEWRRILEQRLSPLYVSVHATDPELRGRLLGRQEPCPILQEIRELADHRIDIHAQIVLCPGWNDGENLLRTIEELKQEHPAASGKRCGVKSVAVVPVGLTRFRERLPNLASADRDYARQLLGILSKEQNRLREKIGTRFVWLSDEWYFLAGRPVPGRAFYENFPQLEDGVGTIRLFQDEAKRVARRLPTAAPKPVSATLVTAEMPAPQVRGFAERLNQVAGVRLDVAAIRNSFFGGGINIAGLITASDILEQVRKQALGDALVLPTICLKDGSLFLDDVTVAELESQAGRPVLVSPPKPAALAATLGLLD